MQEMFLEGGHDPFDAWFTYVKRLSDLLPVEHQNAEGTLALLLKQLESLGCVHWEKAKARCARLARYCVERPRTRQVLEVRRASELPACVSVSQQVNSYRCHTRALGVTKSTPCNNAGLWTRQSALTSCMYSVTRPTVGQIRQLQGK